MRDAGTRLRKCWFFHNSYSGKRAVSDEIGRKWKYSDCVTRMGFTEEQSVLIKSFSVLSPLYIRSEILTDMNIIELIHRINNMFSPKHINSQTQKNFSFRLIMRKYYNNEYVWK